MTTPNATIIVKIKRGTDMRRFSSTVGELTWPELRKRAANSFDVSKESIKLTYVDDEKDTITISNAQELSEAVKLALVVEPSILRVEVVDTNDKNSNTNTTGAAGDAAGGAPGLNEFVETLAKQLPQLVGQLPEHLRAFLPHAELDVDATIAANEAAKKGAEDANVAVDRFCGLEPHGANATPGVHEGVTCDKSGQCPIRGNRYHLIGHNYDLCETEWLKLSERERSQFRKVPPPGAPAKKKKQEAPDAKAAAESKDAPTKKAGAPPDATSFGFHPGVECDRSGQLPIVGTRYHLRGHNYDLCQKEFDKLSSSEKLLYDAIPPPCLPPPGLHSGVHHIAETFACLNKAASANGNANANGHASAHAAANAGCGGRGNHAPPPCGPWRRAWGGAWAGHHGGGGHEWQGNKLCARFVRDVTIFDGTQMTPGTPFTKIWRIKNAGEVQWPPGTRILFVGGDQMTTEMSVPVSRDSPVQPGEEVDVAVSMTAPNEVGRYLGYWRLTGPHCRRRFGQRVWCHIQVVDPSSPVTADAEEVAAAIKEIERKKSDMDADMMAEMDPHEMHAHEMHHAADAAVADKGGAVDTASQTTSTPAGLDFSDKEVAPAADGKDELITDEGCVGRSIFPPVTAEDAPSEKDAPSDKDAPVAPVPVPAAAVEDGASDDGSEVLVTEGMLMDEGTPPNSSDAHASSQALVSNEVATQSKLAEDQADADAPAEAGVVGQLMAMGFQDRDLIATAIAKHGADDLEACARDLAAASEWDTLLDDLEEMGFHDRALNMQLMLKHSGNIKRAVKDLVEG